MQSTSLAPPFPALPLSYPKNVWRCPVTGVLVPKDREKNRAWRLSIFEAADRREANQRSIMRHCFRSPLLWINMCAMTYRQHEVQSDGSVRPASRAEVPMVTWPAQDLFIKEVFSAIHGGEDILADKSRDQGATWLCIDVIAWLFLFRPNFTATMISRKEEEVDSVGEEVAGVRGRPKTLFWKLRYIISRLPQWMQPLTATGDMTFTNKGNHAVVQGESTNLHVSRGDRPQVVLLDECSVYQDLGAIDRSTHRAAATRIFNATPVGPGYYSDLRFSGRCKVVTLGWWNHPEQGRGRHVILEDGKPRWHGPFREVSLKAFSKRGIAQNLDIDHEQAGSLFFDLSVLNYQKQRYASMPPLSTGVIVPAFAGEELDIAIRSANRSNQRPWKFTPSPDGPLRLWTTLERNADGSYSPPRRTQYYMGIDIAQGVGASNSSIAIFARDTNEQVAEWTSSTTDPMKLARVACMLGWWFRGGGASCAFMAWEQNGWGETFAPQIAMLEYPWVYLRTTHEDEKDRITTKVGWWNNDRSNRHVLGRLMADLANGSCIVRSIEALTEAGRYVFTDTGTVEPAGLAEEGAKARAAHGDRLRAVAIANEAKYQVDATPAPEYREVPGTVAWQLEQDRIAEEENDRANEYRY